MTRAGFRQVTRFRHHTQYRYRTFPPGLRNFTEQDRQSQSINKVELGAGVELEPDFAFLRRSRSDNLKKNWEPESDFKVVF